MKSLLLKKHDEAHARARALEVAEMDAISGGGPCYDTVRVTPNGDGGTCTNCDCPKDVADGPCC